MGLFPYDSPEFGLSYLAIMLDHVKKSRGYYDAVISVTFVQCGGQSAPGDP